ncbi:MAG: proline dehydrogenase family protein [Anaerolineae bacterium]|nr:proline dehydrogenase family protein [Anaerolineae bacterium]
MLRVLLLYLAGAGWARSLITHFFVARRVARRFVAGETMADAVSATRRANAEGLLVTLDFLGEAVHSPEDAEQAAAQYLTILDTIAENDLQATVSLKLTQLGLDVSAELCTTNMRRILAHAAQYGNHVTIDMESADYTDCTLQMYRTLRHEYDFDNVGTVIQSYLYRSDADMAALKQEGAFVRLCKGAYKEPPEVAYPDKKDVDASYVRLMQGYLADGAAPPGTYLGIATHDVRMIDAAREIITAHDVPADRYEFQMLYGIRSDLQRELVQQGYKMRVYVPFGTEWYPYFMRRLAERPANLWFFVSNLLRG